MTAEELCRVLMMLGKRAEPSVGSENKPCYTLMHLQFKLLLLDGTDGLQRVERGPVTAAQVVDGPSACGN